MTPVTGTPKTILLIDDDLHMHEICRRVIDKTGYGFLATAEAETGLELIKKGRVDLVLLDYMMPQLDGYHVYKRLASSPEFDHVRHIPVIMLTVLKEDYPKRIELMQMGLSLWLNKPFGPHELINIVENVFLASELKHKTEVEIDRRRNATQRIAEENAYLRAQLQEISSFSNIVGKNPVMQSIFDRIRKIAPTDANVLIHGESGTGKELIARAVHAHSKRGHSPFIPVDCVALPSNLLESELFGHEKGAFTSAFSSKPGLLEMADGGTFFLDEIAELSPDLQAKLLRVLQERQFRRVGGKELIRVDIRIISATNRDPQKAVEDGKLRQDLYYRLNVIPIRIPPLRQRRDDIPLLVHHFLRRFTDKNERAEILITPKAVEALACYDWPGNVRELQNVVERMVSLATGDRLELDDVPESIRGSSEMKIPEELARLPLADARQRWLEQFEKKYLLELLSRCDGNVSRVAQMAQVNRMTIYRRLRSYNINPQVRRSKTANPPRD